MEMVMFFITRKYEDTGSVSMGDGMKMVACCVLILKVEGAALGCRVAGDWTPGTPEGGGGVSLGF